MSVIPETVFKTIHGSHLYGFAHRGSDLDYYIVLASNSRARQSVGNVDAVRIGWKTFIEYAQAGSHQSVEAMFSPLKEWNPKYAYLQSYLDSCRIGGPEVLAKYRRTIAAFAHADDFKRRRHACRLWLNMQDLRDFGRFNPTLTPAQIEWATEVATSNLTGDELGLLLKQGKSAMGNYLEAP